MLTWIGGTYTGKSIQQIVNDNSDFIGADLSGADLIGLRLINKSFIRANLRGARLNFSALVNSTFVDADMHDAQLDMCDTRGANFHRTKGVICLAVGDPRGYRPIAVRHGDSWRIYSGCRSFTVEQALDHWRNSEFGYVKAIKEQLC